MESSLTRFILCAVVGSLALACGEPSADADGDEPAGSTESYLRRSDCDHDDDLTVKDVSFEVNDPNGSGQTFTVKGKEYLPKGRSKNRSSVLLLLHGVSYGKWAWDLPGSAPRYSTARTLAKAGYANIAIDRLGYGESSKPNGYTLSLTYHAAVVGQIRDQLKAAPHNFTKFGLVGHSAGTGISEIAAASGADVLIAEAYNSSATPAVVTALNADVPAALTSDYFYFLNNPVQRADFFYNAATAAPAVIAKDNSLAAPTLSAELLNIYDDTMVRYGAMATISSPVLLVAAGADEIFDPAAMPGELAAFATATDKTLYVAPGVGHSLMLHKTAPVTNAVIVRWLRDHRAQFPSVHD